jgi:hypothetical protein
VKQEEDEEGKRKRKNPSGSLLLVEDAVYLNSRRTPVLKELRDSDGTRKEDFLLVLRIREDSTRERREREREKESEQASIAGDSRSACVRACVRKGRESCGCDCSLVCCCCRQIQRDGERERKRKTLRNCRWLALPPPPSPGTLPPVFIRVVVFFFLVSDVATLAIIHENV